MDKLNTLSIGVGRDFGGDPQRSVCSSVHTLA